MCDDLKRMDGLQPADHIDRIALIGHHSVLKREIWSPLFSMIDAIYVAAVVHPANERVDDSRYSCTCVHNANSSSDRMFIFIKDGVDADPVLKIRTVRRTGACFQTHL
jgi:hypothetical protein